MPGTADIEIISSLTPQNFIESWYELSETSHFWFRWRFKILMEMLGDLGYEMNGHNKILDVGGSTGVLREQVEAATPWDVDITDLDYNALKQVRHGRGRVLYYDIMERRPEFRGVYDLILLFDVLEHIHDPGLFLESVLFHLKKGGHIIINVPALQMLFSNYDSVQGHFRRYNETTLLSEFQASHIKIDDIRYWGLLNIPLLVARKIWLKIVPNLSAEEVLRKGFQPPGKFVNKVFLALMQLETALISHPVWGASLMMIGEKVND